jgi:trehalose 6-phosphate synthase
MAAAVMPEVSLLIGDWSRSDVELRSKLIFNSISDQVALYLADQNEAGLAAFFERLTDDEKLLGLGFCDSNGHLEAATKLMPASVTCEKLARAETPSFSTTSIGGRNVFVASFPLQVKNVSGHVAILHDLSFIEKRASEARYYWALAVAGVTIGLGLLATLLVSNLVRRWRNLVRDSIKDARSGSVPDLSREALTVLGPELRTLLREFRSRQSVGSSIHAEWSRDVLHAVLKKELPDTDVIVASNREPYIHNRVGSKTVLQIPASGLVAALEPVMRACGGTWVAHGSGSADRDSVDAHDRISVPPSAPAYSLRRVWLTEEEQGGYYYGFANEGLWPLCHIAFVRPTFRESDWRMYRSVNERFADAVAEESKDESPIILIQDYHFALLPKMLRERLPGATILTFWHIPWPNAETFSICPWKEEIIEGLLGSDVLGFHTQFHCNNFFETIDRFIESRIDRERASVTLEGHETVIRPYPISIEWPPAALATQSSIADCRKAVRERLGVGQDVMLGVGVERFDYTKGVLDRLRGVDELLTLHPEWRHRFVFVQAAAPTRSKLETYQDLQDEAIALADQINAKHGDQTYQPIRLVIRHHEPDEVYELFRASDVCVVSSLHDGMNLVAKEFVAARDDEEGVLILSHFTGASRELSEAMIVNPYDPHGLGEAINEALTMPVEEQRARMRLMRALVREYNVYRWAGQMLLDAAQIRRRKRVFNLIKRRSATT